MSACTTPSSAVTYAGASADWDGTDVFEDWPEPYRSIAEADPCSAGAWQPPTGFTHADRLRCLPTTGFTPADDCVIFDDIGWHPDPAHFSRPRKAPRCLPKHGRCVAGAGLMDRAAWMIYRLAWTLYNRLDPQTRMENDPILRPPAGR
jgi:hypothetical protein